MQERIRKVGFEAEFMSAIMAEGLVSTFGVRLVDITSAIEHVWWVKSENSIALMQRAGWLCTIGFREASTAISEHQPETVAKGRGDYAVLHAAARHFSDNRIHLYSNVISGERVSAGGGHDLPYGRIPVDGDQVFHVWAVNCDGYWALLSRTTYIGEPKVETRRLYHMVEAARGAALNVVKPGVMGMNIFEAVAWTLRSEKIPKSSIYAGRGIGARMGESPALDAESRVPLQAGTVLRIGPEVFGSFGSLGATDTVLVTLDGYKILTDADAKQFSTQDRVGDVSRG